MDDPFLNYFALGILVFVVVALFYGIIAIHDIPARIAESRHHPHQDAIHAAGWVSLFTLHVLWPFLWIWAMAYRPERGWGFSTKESGPDSLTDELTQLRRRIEILEARAQTDGEPTHPAMDQRRAAPPNVVAIGNTRSSLETEMTEAPMKAGDS